MVPPAVVPLALIAIGVPALARLATGRPRSLALTWLAALAAVAAAQVAGELSGIRIGVLGDAHLAFAAVAAALTSALVALKERASPAR